MNGFSVLFISVPNLIIELKEAMSLNQLNSYKRKFEKYDLVILDELGYVSLINQDVKFYLICYQIEMIRVLLL